MALFKKKTDVELEPEYYTSATNQVLLNYKVHYLSKKEKILWFIVAFIVGAVVAYLFYGGIGKDEYGDPTLTTHICNIVIMSIVGFVAGKFFLPIRNEQILEKRRKELRKQFIDLLDSLSASIASGKNVPGAFMAAKQDLLIQYSEDSYIIQEVDQIVNGIANNISVESMLVDLGNRSGIKDIKNFGKVFETAYQKGGNIKDIVRNSHEILSSKAQIEMEIETKIASNKNEQNLMLFMPILLIGMIKLAGEDFASNFTTPSGLVSTTIAIIAFVVAYFVGKSVMKIEV